MMRAQRGIPVVAAIAILCGCSRPANRVERVEVARIHSDLAPAEQIDHALSRLAYGARPGDADRVRRRGLENWIADQLTPENVDDAAADSLVARYVTLSMPTSDMVTTFRQLQLARRQRNDTTRPPAPVVPNQGRVQLALGEMGAAKLT